MDRLIVDVLNRYLALGVGAQEIKHAGLADVGQTGDQLVRQQDRHRHQFGGLVAGKAEHEPLVAGALLLEHPLAFRHALGDIGRLLVDGGENRTGFPVESHRGVVVADLADGLPDDLRVIDDGVGGYLAGDDRHARGHHGFAGNARLGILGENGVKNCVRYLVGDLVRMPF